ncbi:MAG: response regulator [Lachnospiraceae bacterium]|nr:response regulator [Lachnospiraceae bacterium]
MEAKRNKQIASVERNILVFFTVFASFVFIMSPIAVPGGVDLWVYFVVAISAILPWVAHVKKIRDYRYRALLTSGMMLVCLAIHGMYVSSFAIVAPTIAALTILLAIYGIREVVYQEMAVAVYILLYHIFYLKTVDFSSPSTMPRQIMPVIAVIAVIAVTHYLVCLRQNMESELWEKIEDLEKAEQSKNDFMANVSHEIRTPLNAISGMSEMLLQENLSLQARETVSDIQGAGRRLQALVSDVLDFSELEAGKMSLVEEVYNVTSTINDVINMSNAQKGEKTVELIVDCDANIPSGLVGDEQKLRRIIMNLMNNAIKYTSHGCIVLTVGYRKEEYGINLIIRVADTGIGISEENLEKIFTSFNQVDTKKNRTEGGIGLGLAICSALVKKMEGFIGIRSVQGEGTEVQVVIPQKVYDESPIVSLNRASDAYVALYLKMEKFEYVAVREAYRKSITRMAGQLESPISHCVNLQNLKNQLEKKNFTHVFIGWEEFCEDKKYFEELSTEIQVVLILERDMAAYVGGRIQCIYKPFYVLSMAAVINGERVLQSGDLAFAHGNRFIAPEAKVLVVDDNLMNLKVVEGLLRPYQIKVFTATGGREALKKLESMQYDFVFMDHMMPEMDGVETLHKIRQKPGRYFAELPVIALTANAIGGVREMFLEEGFQDFMAKPIELSVLERTLRRYLPEGKILKVEDADLHLYEPQEELEKEKALALRDKMKKEPLPGAPEMADEEFNPEKGIARCGGNEEDYIEIARAFYAAAEENMEQIGRFYQERDWKNYTILVHALKSSALYIGAAQLSEAAKALELSGKESRTDYIDGHHEEMFSMYRRLLERMLACELLGLEEKKTEEKSPVLTNIEIDREELFRILDELKSRIGDFETEGVEACLAELEPYRFRGKPLSILADRLRGKVQNFDFMGAEELLEAAFNEFK